MVKKLFLTAILAAPLFLKAQNSQTTSKSNYTPKVILSPSVGYAWRLAKMPAGIDHETRKYLKGLKSGMDIGFSAYYSINRASAIGLRASGYFASSDGRITVKDYYGNNIIVPTSTKDNISYFGPAFMFSNFNEETKHKLFYEISLGVISYTTKTENIEGKGSSLGAEFNFGYQYELSKNISIGPKLGVSGGTLSKMKFNGTTVNFDNEEKEGLTRLSLSASATFRF